MTVAERRDEDEDEDEHADRAHPHFWAVGLIDGPAHSTKLVPFQMASRSGETNGLRKVFYQSEVLFDFQ